MLRETKYRLPDLRRLQNRTDGSVALEYAVIAFIVGLGIVIGLVGVKTRSAVETDSQYMIDNGGRTDIWTQRIQTYDNTNPNATTYSAVCTYQGGRTAAC